MIQLSLRGLCVVYTGNDFNETGIEESQEPDIKLHRKKQITDQACEVPIASSHSSFCYHPPS